MLVAYGVQTVLDVACLSDPSYGDFIANPTLAAGDVQISKDGGAWTNLATLPTVTPAAGTGVRITIGSAEATCKIARIRFIDQTSPKQWGDVEYVVYTFGHASAYFIGDFNDIASNDTLNTVAANVVTCDAAVDVVGAEVSLVHTHCEAMAGDLQTLVARTSTSVTLLSPVISTGAIELVQGDDYKAADGRAISFTLTAHGYTLAGATCKLTIVDENDENAAVMSTGTITEAGADATLTFELTAVQTATLSASDNRHKFDIQITIAPGAGQRIVTPYRGSVTVLKQFSV